MRRKWYVITFLVIVVTTVTIGTFMAEPQYRAVITLKIDKENPNILAFEDVVGLEVSSEDYYQTQYKMLKSRNLAKRVIRSLQLANHPEFAPDQKAKGAAAASVFPGQDDPLKDEGISPGIVDAFISKVEVSPVQKSRLVNVSFASADPELSATVANEIGRSFIGLNIESKFEATYQARVWLEKQLEIMKAKVEQAEEKLNEYAAKNEIIFLPKDAESGKDNQNIIIKKLSELSTELTEATAERIGKEALYREVQSDNPESSSVVINNPLISSLKRDLAGLESEYNEQLKIYKPDYPKMVVLKEHIDQIKKRIDIEAKKIIRSIKKDYEVELKREQNLQSILDAAKKDALAMNEKSIQYHILKREADTNKELYNGLLQRLKETGVSSSLTASNIQVIDRAEVPLRPYKPRKALNIMLSLIAGLFGGIGIAFFTEYFDKTIKTPEDVNRRVQLSPIGFVPEHTNRKINVPIELIAHSDNRNPIAEAYRSIRTFLLLATGGSPPRVMMITSTARGEGKTTTAVNTAVTLAKSDVKVLLVDADMRKSKLHKIFGVDNRTGLSSYLSGTAGFGDDLVKKTYIPNLDILTAGHTPPNPVELLSSHRYQELIDDLVLLYHFIVIDTPPLLGISDALIVNTKADGVILVVRSGKTPKEAVQEARRILQSVNANILGVVLNSLPQSSMKYSYYYDYYRHYYTHEDT